MNEQIIELAETILSKRTNCIVCPNCKSSNIRKMNCYERDSYYCNICGTDGFEDRFLKSQLSLTRDDKEKIINLCLLVLKMKNPE